MPCWVYEGADACVWFIIFVEEVEEHIHVASCAVGPVMRDGSAFDETQVVERDFAAHLFVDPHRCADKGTNHAPGSVSSLARPSRIESKTRSAVGHRHGAFNAAIIGPSDASA